MIEFLEFESPAVNKREILRYASSREEGKTEELLEECLAESLGVLKYQVVFCELKFTINGDICDFDDFSVKSASLAKNLSTAKKVYLFLASVGHGIDRLIAKYSRVSAAKALMFSAIGNERVEALSDELCNMLSDRLGMGAIPRFSAGYGDLSLSLQKDIFNKLSPERLMGVYLSESCVMSPSKSVTAFVGFK